MKREERRMIQLTRCEKTSLKNIMRVEVPGIMKEDASIEELTSRL